MSQLRVTVRVKVLRKHSRACSMVRSHPQNPWAFFGSRDRLPDRPGFEQFPLAIYLNSDGKKRKGAMDRWITAGCNDLDCPGVIAVRESDLLTIAEGVAQ